jgi:hypothetical protein
VVVVGATTSDDLPGTDGRPQPPSGACDGDPPCSDGFVAALGPERGDVQQVTYLGGPAYDDLTAVAIGHDGSLTVTGTSCGQFPVTRGAFRTQLAGGRDGCDDIVARLDPTLEGLLYATYVGPGDHADERVLVDDLGRAILVSETPSTDYPVTSAAFQPHYGGGPLDVVVAVLSPDGTGLVYSTYIGGSGDDMYWSSHPFLTADGRLYVSGLTGSPDLPTTDDAPQPEPGGGYDGFILTIDLAVD